jgi:hypothetical protein
MKLVIKEYLASLNERNELDAILPDLLSQLGLTVFGKPIRGASERGVDVAAVGSIYGGIEKVYLFSIKAGDLTRSTWNGNEDQALRPSLDEIIDSYIPNRLPPEHKGKPIVICPCFGGDVQTPVIDLFTGYMNSRSKDNIEFEVWHGDKLAGLINDDFLHENFMPENTRSLLRKSLAILDEPDASFSYFSYLLSILRESVEEAKAEDVLKVLRQINICLWILYGWSRQEKNLESVYLSSEISYLNAWHISSPFLDKKSKNAKLIQLSLQSIQKTYLKVSQDYLAKVVMPYMNDYGAISRGVSSSSSVDINLKLFDLLGRVALMGLWCTWELEVLQQNDEYKVLLKQHISYLAECIFSLIRNNPILFSPLKDEQAIDISLAVLFLAASSELDGIKDWFGELLSRIKISFKAHGAYPCTLQDYMELLEHPKANTKEYLENCTAGSILFSSIGFFSALFNFDDEYKQVSEIQTEFLEHCSLQLWYPDDESEKGIYIGERYHGLCLSDFDFTQKKDVIIERVFDECKETKDFENLSAIKYGVFPLLLMSCRAYRLPVPMQFFENFRMKLT